MKSFSLKMALILLLISIVGIIICGGCCLDRSKRTAECYTSSCAEKYGLFLFNTSCNFYNYFIEIVDSATIAASVGASCVGRYEAIYNNNPKEMDFYHGQQYKECAVGSAKTSAIKQRLEQMTCIQNPFLRSIYSDTWAGVFMSGKKRIIFILSDHANDEIGMLTQMLVGISPMPIGLYHYGCWPVSDNN